MFYYITTLSYVTVTMNSVDQGGQEIVGFLHVFKPRQQSKYMLYDIFKLEVNVLISPPKSVISWYFSCNLEIENDCHGRNFILNNI